MKIFLRRIKCDANHKELNDFVADAFRPKWYWPFRNNGLLSEHNILRIRDKNSIEYHGLADIHPERAALRAIIVLNGKRFAGQIVEVRKWYDRSQARDRRKRVSQIPADLPHSDRRCGDRRRKDLNIEII